MNLDFDYFFLLWDHTNTEIIDHHQLLHFSMWVGICLYLMITGTQYLLYRNVFICVAIVISQQYRQSRYVSRQKQVGQYRYSNTINNFKSRGEIGNKFYLGMQNNAPMSCASYILNMNSILKLIFMFRPKNSQCP